MIVPIYNRLKNFRMLYKCLLTQSVQVDELIIADDGSNEEPLEYIKDLEKKAEMVIKHIKHEDLGFRKARILNEAVKNSQGDILIFSDQDLIFGQDYVEEMAKVEKRYFKMGRAANTEEEEARKIRTQLESEVNYKEIIMGVPKKYKESVKSEQKSDEKRRLLQRLKLKKRGIKLVGMSYSLRKEDYMAINGYDEKYFGWGYEDDDFGNRLTAHKVKGEVLYTKEILLHLWHKESGSKGKNLNEKYYRERKKSVKKEGPACKFGVKNSYYDDKVKLEELKW